MSDKLRAAAQAALESTKSLFVCCSDFSHLPQDLHPDGKCIPWWRYNDALTALEAALAEPAIKESLTVAKPEPVAWMSDSDVGFYKEEFGNYPCVPLYTAPPRREWVGLTDDERDSITDKVIGFNSCCGWEDDYAKAIEAKLREKNGG